MKDWQAYSQSRATNNPMTGGKQPTVFEYACIKVIDNGSIVVLVFLICTFFGAGAAINIWGSSENAKVVSALFFDGGKLCLGVLLGVWSQRRKSN